MKTKNEIREMAADPKLSAREYILFSSHDKEGDYGEIIQAQDFDLLENCDHGEIDEFGEFVDCDRINSSAMKISWWDGNNTEIMYAHEDEIETRCLICVCTDIEKERGSNQSYITYYFDIDNSDIYVELSDNTQQNIKQELILL